MSHTGQAIVGPRALAQEPSFAAAPANPAARISLRSCLQWSLVGNVVYAACQWAVLIVLAKLGSAEAVGQFALGLALTAPVMLFANLQLGSLQATDATREYRFGHYLALRLITTGLALAAIGGLVLAIGYSDATATVVLAVGLAKAFEAVSDAYHGLMQQHARMDRVAWSLMLKGPLSVLAMIAGVCLMGGVVAGAIALAATWGLLLALYDIRSAAWLRRAEAGLGTERFIPCWDWGALGRLAWLALPLGVCTVLITLSFNIPRYFVEQQLGVEQLGIFAAMACVSVVGVVLSNSIGQAAAPRLASYYAAADLYAFRLLVLRLAGVGALLGGAGVLVAWLAGPPLLTLLYRPEYAEHVDEFTGIMAGAALWCVATMFFNAATAARRQRSQAMAAAAIALATLAASAVLIQGESLAGAAAAMFVNGAVALFVLGAIFVTTGKPAAAATQAGGSQPGDENFTEGV